MDEPEVYHAIPDTAMSVLEMFQPMKEGIISFVSKVICDMEDGKVDPLRVKLLCKTLTEIAKKIDEGTKENQAKEAAKYGDKAFMLNGNEFHYTAVHTEYDYSHDEPLNKLKEQVKARELFLRSLKEPLETIDGDAVVFTIRPAIKKQTDGVKISIK